MAITFPQIERGRCSGGRDCWDDNAGSIVSQEYFFTEVISGNVTINLNSVSLNITVQNITTLLQLALTNSQLKYAINDLALLINLSLNNSLLDCNGEPIQARVLLSCVESIFSLDTNNIDFSTPTILELDSKALPLQSTSLSLVQLEDLSLNQLIYVKLFSLGYTGSIDDMLLKYFKDNGATSNSINDAEVEWLAARGYSNKQVMDSYRAMLEDMGYTGTFNDKILKFWYFL
jgi:hypothetical protein